jgi:hypothetical protein
VHYAGEVVVHQGSTWQARKDTGQAPPHADWIGLAFRGVDGASPQVRGIWRSDGDYRALDIVALNGGSFIARKDDPGSCPGEGWQSLVLAKRGTPGEPGPQGPRGERGERGEGAPHLVGWRIDRAKYRAVAEMSDGSELALELRGLFEQFNDELR